MDLHRARVLTEVRKYWMKRVKELTPSLTEVLGVDSVWCDSVSELGSQNFVLWAGLLLEERCGGGAIQLLECSSLRMPCEHPRAVPKVC